MSKKIEANYAITINKENKFIYYACDKERLCIETINAYGKRFSTKEELLFAIENKYGTYHHHPLTGPIHINNAKLGDIIKVHINKIKVQEMGQSLSKSAGIEPLKITTRQTRCPTIGYLNDNIINYAGKFTLEYRPMIGMIATTPLNGLIKTGHASKRNGGNLDLPFASVGADIYLPVDINGAGLYLGDVHSIEGYGELSGISLEASSEIDLTIETIKDNNSLKNIIIIGTEPVFHTQGIAVVGIGEKEDLHSAIKDAYIGSCDILKRIFPEVELGMIKNIISLIGQSINGQAYAKTSESTTMIFFKKEDIEKLLGRNIELEEIENIIFKGGIKNDTKNKTRCL